VSAAAPATDATPRDLRSGWPAVAALLAAYILCFMDRQAVGLLAAPLERAFHVSKVQIGWLQGGAFAVVLSAVGIAAGRLVDRSRRVLVLAIAVLAWSASTFASGLASSFLALLLCRACVAAGEAAMTPSAYSLIGDYIPRRRWGLAFSLYGLGPYLGSGLALMLGASLAQPTTGQGWRAVFMIFGALGLPAALAVTALREPQRSAAPKTETTLAAYGRLGRRWGTTAAINLAASLTAMAIYAYTAWAPTIVQQAFPHPAQTTAALGAALAASGAAGALLGGALGDQLRSRGAHRLAAAAAAAVLAAPFAGAAGLAQTPPVFLGCMSGFYLFASMVIVIAPAALQDITPGELRGAQHALAVLSVNLLGLGLGPVGVAALAQAFPAQGRAIGLALAVSTPVMLLASAVFAVWATAQDRRAEAAG
jgi:MFS family permease